MSELYSSESGSYETYLSERQVDKITTTIKQATDIQMMGMAATTGVLGSKLDSMNAKLKVIGTGLYTAVSKNTLQVAASTEMLKKTFNEGFDSVNNRLDLGFAGISSEIGAMTAAMTAGFDQMKVSLDYWGNEICDKLDAIHDIVNNPLLTASRELYRRAVANAKKQFFEEALEDIKGAVEKNKTDYISWGLMGRIYLFGVSEFSNAIDVPKALEAFTNACKYISPDTDESEEAKKMAAEYYFYAAYANYILANESRIANNTEDVKKYLEDSVKANSKSFALSNTMFEALYDKARAYSLLQQKESALKTLEEAIRADGLYSVKALGDPDFKWLENDIVSLITNLRDETYQKLQSIKPEVLKITEEYEFFGGFFCEFVKDAAKNINDIKEDSAYLDVRNNFDKNTISVNVIKNNSAPYEMIYEDYGYKHKYIRTQVLKNLTEAQRKRPLTTLDGVKIENSNQTDFTLHVKRFYAYLYETEKDESNHLKQAYELEFIQDKYFTPSVNFMITDKKEGRSGDNVFSLNADKFFFNKDGSAYIQDHELVYMCDNNTKIIFNYVLKRKEEINENLGSDRRNYQPHIKVFQRVIVPKQYIQQIEERKKREIAEKKAKEDAIQAEKIKKQKEIEEQRKNEQRQKEKEAKKKNIGKIIAIIGFVIPMIIGLINGHPIIGGIIGAFIGVILLVIFGII